MLAQCAWGRTTGNQQHLLLRKTKQHVLGWGGLLVKTASMVGGESQVQWSFWNTKHILRHGGRSVVGPQKPLISGPASAGLCLESSPPFSLCWLLSSPTRQNSSIHVVGPGDTLCSSNSFSGSGRRKLPEKETRALSPWYLGNSGGRILTGQAPGRHSLLTQSTVARKDPSVWTRCMTCWVSLRMNLIYEWQPQNHDVEDQPQEGDIHVRQSHGSPLKVKCPLDFSSKTGFLCVFQRVYKTFKHQEELVGKINKSAHCWDVMWTGLGLQNWSLLMSNHLPSAFWNRTGGLSDERWRCHLHNAPWDSHLSL